MSEALYPTRLYWTPLGGFARYEGHEVPLAAPPVLPGLAPVQSIDYAPGTVALVLPKFGALRELEPEERHAALQLLVRLAGPSPQGEPS